MKNFFLIYLLIFHVSNILNSQQNKSPLISSYIEYIEHKKSTPFDIDWIQIGPVINSARVESIQVDEKKSRHNVCSVWIWKPMENYQ